ncbi:uncharacterized protein N7482_005117 [Penicillium canariense]|uniref:Rieske domain-containing protein n=1 Tax=Penicillium canariense TaxID=189055 RepID=A0A9W9I3B2_9EURO|nr:uncharacterized protein N7482_005117 [Penicillium canariense]KAJ5166336.1 hypothetical protein N7482_005117 [Penicillium canariense]
MECLDAYVLSPGPLIVTLLTLAFLVNQAWPLFSRQKKNYQLSDSKVINDDHNNLTVSKEPEVPGGWWSGRDVFELERRALFSKSWLYLAHRTQFSKPGAYQSFDIAGFPIFLIRGKDDKIRAFHNVCRHRAYTITRKETGTSTVLGCRYHGWSYDTTGRLVKAPQFDNIPEFDKSENSLFEIHAYTSNHGWVFVNLDAGEPPHFPKSTILALDEFVQASGLGSKSEWITGQTLAGSFNWKSGMSARYFADVTAQLEKLVSAETSPSMAAKFIQMITPKKSQAECPLFPGTFLYSFANAGLWLSLSFLPASEMTTQVRYDLISLCPMIDANKNALTTAVGGCIQDFVQYIEADFRYIAERPAERSPNTRHILHQLQEHAKLERKSGGQILPAMRQPKGSALFQQAEQLCKDIDCVAPGSGPGLTPGGLDW